MALIYCKHCGGKVSDKAVTCPHCGFSLKEGQPQNIIESPQKVTFDEDPYEEADTPHTIRNIVVVVAVVMVVMCGLAGYFGTHFYENAQNPRFDYNDIKDTVDVDTVDVDTVVVVDSVDTTCGADSAAVAYDEEYNTSQNENYHGFKTSSDVFNYLNGKSFSYDGTTITISSSGIYVDGDNLGTSPSIRDIKSSTALIISKQAKLRLDSDNSTLTDLYSGTVYYLDWY